MTTPPASLTVACSAVPNEVPTKVDCGVPAVVVMEAGTCTTGTLLSEPVAAFPELVWVRSPPPYALAVLVTEVGELAGTFTTT